MSLPQKDEEGKRTDAEGETFGRGLRVMGFLYASVTGTLVLMRKHIPDALSVVAPSDVASYNSTPYDSRGWVRCRLGFEHISQ